MYAYEKKSILLVSSWKLFWPQRFPGPSWAMAIRTKIVYSDVIYNFVEHSLALSFIWNKFCGKKRKNTKKSRHLYEKKQKNAIFEKADLWKSVVRKV